LTLLDLELPVVAGAGAVQASPSERIEAGTD
jgi:hypothetical protein